VNAAFANPPQSTEQVLHPGRYRTGDKPRLVTHAALDRHARQRLAGWWIKTSWASFPSRCTWNHASRRSHPHWPPRAGEEIDTRLITTILNRRRCWPGAPCDNEAEAREFVSNYDLYLADVFGHEADSTQDNARAAKATRLPLHDVAGERRRRRAWARYRDSRA